MTIPVGRRVKVTFKADPNPSVSINGCVDKVYPKNYIYKYDVLCDNGEYELCTESEVEELEAH